MIIADAAAIADNIPQKRESQSGARNRKHLEAPVAQWIEQWIPNPCAASSILAGGTKTFFHYSNCLKKLPYAIVASLYYH